MANDSKITFSIPDMTCGHCVKTITNAITDVFPSAQVAADLPSHSVSITGVNDATKLSKIIKEEGYTPEVC